MVVVMVTVYTWLYDLIIYTNKTGDCLSVYLSVRLWAAKPHGLPGWNLEDRCKIWRIGAVGLKRHLRWVNEQKLNNSCSMSWLRCRYFFFLGASAGGCNDPAEGGQEGGRGWGWGGGDELWGNGEGEMGRGQRGGRDRDGETGRGRSSGKGREWGGGDMEG